MNQEKKNKTPAGPDRLPLFASCPRKTSTLLADELREMGIKEVSEVAAGVRFSGDLGTAYRVILWSRVASRVLMELAQFDAPDQQALYDGVKTVDWSTHLNYSKTIAVDFTSTRSALNHTRFGALRVKDAIVDQFVEKIGARPSVNTREPDLRINVHVHNDKAILSIDLSGESLHKRGYREEGGTAPLKESLAAAILLRSDWAQIAKAGGPLVDPMCGSGTLLIEGAMIAGNIAPGLLRAHFGFLGWKGHDKPLWAGILGNARKLAQQGKNKIPPILGMDADPVAVRHAMANVHRAGLAGYVRIEKRPLAKARPPLKTRSMPGLIIVNPPYGQRLGTEQEVIALYQKLGIMIKKRFSGYNVAILTGNPDAAKNIDLGKRKTSVFYNGPIECKLLRYAPDSFTAC